MDRSFNLRIPDDPRLALVLLLHLIHQVSDPLLGLASRLKIPLEGDIQDIPLLAAGREQRERNVELGILLSYKDGYFPLSLLPEGCREGDILTISIERDPGATSQAKERVSGLMDKLKKKGQGKTGIIRDPEVK